MSEKKIPVAIILDDDGGRETIDESCFMCGLEADYEIGVKATAKDGTVFQEVKPVCEVCLYELMKTLKGCVENE